MARLIWMGYSASAHVFLTPESFAVLLSQEGARMGDKFGSFVYCLTVHPAYMAVRRRCPNVVI
jgi:hypothetical protein